MPIQIATSRVKIKILAGNKKERKNRRIKLGGGEQGWEKD